MKKGDCCLLLLLLRRCKKSLEINSAAKHHSDAPPPPHIIAASDRDSPHIAEGKKTANGNRRAKFAKNAGNDCECPSKKNSFFDIVVGIFLR